MRGKETLECPAGALCKCAADPPPKMPSTAPRVVKSDIWLSHTGGRMHIMSDGKAYAATGLWPLKMEETTFFEVVSDPSTLRRIVSLPQQQWGEAVTDPVLQVRLLQADRQLARFYKNPLRFQNACISDTREYES